MRKMTRIDRVFDITRLALFLEGTKLIGGGLAANST
jgi:hypothetical protein